MTARLSRQATPATPTSTHHLARARTAATNARITAYWARKLEITSKSHHCAPKKPASVAAATGNPTNINGMARIRKNWITGPG